MTTRRILPTRRFGETFDVRHGNTSYQVCIGYFPDDHEPAEAFISGAKAGSDIEGLARDGAVVISIALQYGVPLTALAGAITRNPNGTPMTVVGAVLDKIKQDRDERLGANREVAGNGSEPI